MNLADRYELSESVTTGAVETFPARDIVTGEPVLVHVFESAATRPSNVPTIQWVLEAFERIAPPPKELVVNAGRYAGTAFVYLVTKLPGPNSLQEWIESYSRYGSGTKEIARIPKTESVRQPQQAPPTTIDKGQETTAMPVFSIEPAVRPSTPNAEAFNRATDSSEQTRPPTGTFTSLFISNFNKGDFAGTAGTPQEPGTSFTEQLSTGPSPRATSALDLGAPSETGATPDAGTGDFTKFFKGPFSGEPSLDTPKNLSLTTPAPVATVGEFTRTFGPVASNGDLVPAETPVGGDTERLSLTQILAQPPTRPEEPPPLSPERSFPPAFEQKTIGVPPREVTEGLNAVDRGLLRAPAHFAPLPGPEPPIVRENSATVGFDKDNATRLFSSFARHQEEALPAGPSEYTRVIARPIPPPEPAIEQSSAGARPQPSVSVPALSMAMPPQPPMHIPGMQPTPPVSLAPPAVKPPQLPPAPKPATSYWPLILGMTVLFFMAVLLVMYFVLKH